MKRIVGTRITDQRELRGYVLRTSAVCAALAVSVDVVNHAIFFIGWPEALRSWAISALLGFGLALVVSRIIGKANLELYRAKQAVEKVSRTDPLTGLPNRRALLERAEAPEAMILVIFDIDRFKRINDTYGHLAGDEVIRAIANAMAAELGDLGQLGRLGGEEFALLASGGVPEDLSARLCAFCDRIAGTPVIFGNVAVRVTVSAGVALRGPGTSFGQLYSEADQALYLAKAAGRNRIVFADATAMPPAGEAPAARQAVA